MTRLALAVYRFFRKRRAVFYIILLGSFVLLAFLAGRMYYEEDITKLLPATEENSGVRYVFDKLRVKDKIFVELRITDSTMSPQDMVDTLVSASDRLCDSIKAHDKGGYMEDVFNRIDPSLLEDGAFLILDNAPCFLDSTFYPSLDNLLNAKSLDSLMQKNADLLADDPSGMWYDIVCKDPLAFRSLAMKNLASAGGDLSDGSAHKDNGKLTLTDFHLMSSDSTVAIAYLPDRMVTLQHLGDNRFRVSESRNSKLQSGDEVEIQNFILHHPLFVSNVWRAGKSIGQFTAGRISGLQSISIIEP